MAEQRFEDIFNACLDLLADGATIRECLDRYPEYAERLRPLLEAGLSVRGLEVPSAEVQAAQEAVWSRVEAGLAGSAVLPWWQTPWIWSVAAILVITLGVVMFINLNTDGPNQADAPEVVTFTPVMTQPATGEPTLTPEPSTTREPTITPEPSPTTTPAIVSVTGVITALEEDVITLLGSITVLITEETILPARDLIVGDDVRVEGFQPGEDLIAVEIILLTVDSTAPQSPGDGEDEDSDNNEDEDNDDTDDDEDDDSNDGDDNEDDESDDDN